MRKFDKSQRLPINLSNCREMFLAELEYYRNNNQYPVKLFGKDIINIYRNINLQVLVTEICNMKCPFCIEDKWCMDNPEQMLSILENILIQYNRQGIFPAVSITGGEPGLFPDRVKSVIEVLNAHQISRYNLNTNGTDFAKFGHVEFTNLSRHHHWAEASTQIFAAPHLFENFVEDSPVNMQCVLTAGAIDSLDQIKQYMKKFLIYPNVKGFSFRGLSKMDTEKEYLSKQVEYCDAKFVNIFEILDQVAGDPNFEFVQQKIGDHFFFEIWRYRGVPVRFTYSDFSLLREIETKERANGDWFSRATIIRPDGAVYAGWTYDINPVLVPAK